MRGDVTLTCETFIFDYLYDCCGLVVDNIFMIMKFLLLSEAFGS